MIPFEAMEQRKNKEDIVLFDKEQLVRLRPLAIFTVGYTVLFYLFAVTIKYTFPFVAGLLLALLAQPLIRLLHDRLKMKTGTAAALATLAAYLIFFGILFLLGYWLVGEISNLLAYISRLSKNSSGVLTGPVNIIINQLMDSLNKIKIDAEFIQKNREQLMNIAQAGAGVTTAVLGKMLQFLTSLPAIFTMLIVMVFSTYFFSKDLGAIKSHTAALLSPRTAQGLKAASYHGANMSGKWICSYLLIYFLTFLETLVVFSMLGIPYPLVLSIITGVADILPVLGPGTMYIPLAIIYLITGKFFKAGALLVCWLLITVIRQIVEPKLVSSSINIHPLTMLAAIYFALVAGNFWVLIYVASLALVYEILVKEALLPRIFPAKKNPEPETAPPKEP